MGYIGFKMGKWNADKKEVEYDPSRVVSNKALRQAMGYAIDNAAIGEKFYNGFTYSSQHHYSSPLQGLQR